MSESPYIIEKRVIEIWKYNPNYGDHRICKCGHTYYRHFDSLSLFEEMEAIGCKYCDCCEFEEDENVNNNFNPE